MPSCPNVSPASCFTAALLDMVLKGLGDSRPNRAMGQKWICAVTIDVEADALRSRLWSHSHRALASMQFSLQAKLKVQILFQHSARKLPGLLLELSLMTGPNFLALTLLQQGLLGWRHHIVGPRTCCLAKELPIFQGTNSTHHKQLIACWQITGLPFPLFQWFTDQNSFKFLHVCIFLVQQPYQLCVNKTFG